MRTVPTSRRMPTPIRPRARAPCAIVVSARTASTAAFASSTERMSAKSTLWKPEPIARIAWCVYCVCSILIMPDMPISSNERPRLSRSCMVKGAYSAVNST